MFCKSILVTLCVLALANAQQGYSRDSPITQLGYGGPDQEYTNQDEESSGGEIPGEAGRDYPIFAEVPATSFDCNSQQYPGYYADTEAQCQVFHICQRGGKSDAFLCPNGTVFNQEFLVCDWWYNFDCSRAESLYSVNEQVVIAMEEADARLAQQGYSAAKNDFQDPSAEYGVPTASGKDNNNRNPLYNSIRNGNRINEFSSNENSLKPEYGVPELTSQRNDRYNSVNVNAKNRLNNENVSYKNGNRNGSFKNGNGNESNRNGNIIFPNQEYGVPTFGSQNSFGVQRTGAYKNINGNSINTEYGAPSFTSQDSFGGRLRNGNGANKNGNTAFRNKNGGAPRTEYGTPENQNGRFSNGNDAFKNRNGGNKNGNEVFRNGAFNIDNKDSAKLEYGVPEFTSQEQGDLNNGQYKNGNRGSSSGVFPEYGPPEVDSQINARFNTPGFSDNDVSYPSGSENVNNGVSLNAFSAPSGFGGKISGFPIVQSYKNGLGNGPTVDEIFPPIVDRSNDESIDLQSADLGDSYSQSGPSAPGSGKPPGNSYLPSL